VSLVLALMLAQSQLPDFAPASPASQGIDPARLDEFGAVVQGYVDAEKIVGAELVVIRDEVLELKQAASDWKRIDALGAFRFRSRIELPALKLSGTAQGFVQGLARMRVENDFGSTKECELLRDGRGWSWSSDEELEERFGLRLEQQLLEHPFVPIADWRELYRSIDVLAEVERSGTPALWLRAEPREGYAHTRIVSLESGLPLALSTVESVTGLGKIGSVTEYGDWREVGGLKLPFHRRVAFATPLLGVFEERWEEVEAGIELNEDTFEPPDDGPR